MSVIGERNVAIHSTTQKRLLRQKQLKKTAMINCLAMTLKKTMKRHKTRKQNRWPSIARQTKAQEARI